MSIEYTKVDAANRQAFYETLLAGQGLPAGVTRLALCPAAPGSLPKAAIAIAPRPKWKHLPDTDDFVLPITA